MGSFICEGSIVFVSNGGLGGSVVRGRGDLFSQPLSHPLAKTVGWFVPRMRREIFLCESFTILAIAG